MHHKPLLKIIPVLLLVACEEPTAPVIPDNAVVLVSSLGAHNCSLNAGGDVYCWGFNNSGQAGSDTSVATIDPTRVSLPGPTVWIATGDLHSCSLNAAGEAWCWGLNASGQTGIGSSGRGSPVGPWIVATPTAVATSVRFRSLTGGAEHTCGLALDGAGYCWGKNTAGQTGREGSTAPTPAPFLVPGGLRFTALSAASYSNCGITVDGPLYCWGSYLASSGWVSFRAMPTLLSESPRFQSIDGGGYHLCGVTIDGLVYCWGSARFGELGIGGDLEQARAQPVRIESSHRFMSVSAGDFFTCAIRTDRKAMCWGDGRSGQLGNGAMEVTSSIPIEVAGNVRFRELSAGTEHACGVSTDAKVYCWGRLRSASGQAYVSQPTLINLGM